MMIRKIVLKVLRTGYLSAEIEEQLQQLFHSGCSLDEIDALADLQYAVMAGHVERASCQVREKCLLNSHKNDKNIFQGLGNQMNELSQIR
ncbi:hypothetical protein [Microcoleus sp. FACHB-672]|uniref:hypothetical protein n=1 Tax=Microcoleus sp. FACHB-672 TaxID=2692825 RepID=UPI0016830D26|nr:hypothetical protein [Microcoleus sp. FACHB-672]MBD2039560.1 hypothetical protein [Microcoleus sp. FACHB-672]